MSDKKPFKIKKTAPKQIAGRGITIKNLPPEQKAALDAAKEKAAAHRKVKDWARQCKVDANKAVESVKNKNAPVKEEEEEGAYGIDYWNWSTLDTPDVSPDYYEKKKLG